MVDIYSNESIDSNNQTNEMNDKVSIGKDPRTGQVQRYKRALDALDKCSIHIAEMGTIYMEFNEPELSEYCMALYQSIAMIRESVAVLKTHM